MTRLGYTRVGRDVRTTTASALLAVLAVGGCSTVNAPSLPGSSPRGDDQIRATARGIFAAMGLTDRMVEGRYQQREKETGCAKELGIPTEQAWSARRGYAVETAAPSSGGGSSSGASTSASPAGAFDPATVYDRAVTHLRGTGWTVQEYEGPFGGAPAFRATQADSFVLYFGADTTFSVVVGPCTRVFPTLTEPQYHPVPHGRFTTPHPPKPPIRN
jgi:hypothetical protein